MFFWTSTCNGSFLGPPCMNLDIKFPFPHRFSTVWKHHRILVTHATSWVAACASAAARRATVRTVPMASFACEAASASALALKGDFGSFQVEVLCIFFTWDFKIPWNTLIKFYPFLSHLKFNSFQHLWHLCSFRKRFERIKAVHMGKVCLWSAHVENLLQRRMNIFFEVVGVDLWNGDSWTVRSRFFIDRF